jgi:limonene-1,2-epoxide hydrolase
MVGIPSATPGWPVSDCVPRRPAGSSARGGQPTQLALDPRAVASALVSGLEVVNGFWAAMQANDWHLAASCLAPECEVDWPCSGERIVGRENFAALQARYPTNTGAWSFDVHRVVADGDLVVSEVTVTDGEQAARVIAFSEIEDGLIARQVEYWPTAYDPLPGREDLTVQIDRVP